MATIIPFPIKAFDPFRVNLIRGLRRIPEIEQVQALDKDHYWVDLGLGRHLLIHEHEQGRFMILSDDMQGVLVLDRNLDIHNTLSLVLDCVSRLKPAVGL